MTDKPKKEKHTPKDEKPTIFKTDDEIMDEVFSPEVRKKLKDLAHDHRPNEKDD